MTQDAHNATKSVANLSANPFWDYSLTVYKQAGCADFLLSAQESYSADINILLYIGWLAKQHKIYTPSGQQRDSINEFQKYTIGRVRQLRVRAKHLSDHNLYNELKQLELLAESIEQTRLFRQSESMALSNLDFEGSVKQSFDVYISQVGSGADVLIDETWMQTFIEYLQPGNKPL